MYYSIHNFKLNIERTQISKCTGNKCEEKQQIILDHGTDMTGSEPSNMFLLLQQKLFSKGELWNPLVDQELILGLQFLGQYVGKFLKTVAKIEFKREKAYFGSCYQFTVHHL